MSGPCDVSSGPGSEVGPARSAGCSALVDAPTMPVDVFVGHVGMLGLATGIRHERDQIEGLSGAQKLCLVDVFFHVLHCNRRSGGDALCKFECLCAESITGINCVDQA